MSRDFTGSFDRFPLNPRRVWALLIPIVILAGLAGCGAALDTGEGLEFESAWARPARVPVAQHDDRGAPGPGEEGGAGDHHHSPGVVTSAGYLVIRNHGSEPDRLLAAESEVAGTVELHLSSIEDGVMRMRQVPGIDIPARGAAVLEPGGYHLMLIGLEQDLEAGDTLAMTLTFEKGGSRVIELEVRAQ